MTPRQTAFLDLARNLLRLERRVEGVIDAALRDSHDLDLRALFVLASLDGGPRRPGELSEALNLPPPSVTRTVERLVERGWVTRRRGRDDRRRVDLELTAAGRTSLDEARAVLSQALADAWPDVPDARAADLAKGLARLVEGGAPHHG
jgi:DNA-binding MarR family transcriptional regulator